MKNDTSVWTNLFRLIIWAAITVYIIYFFNFQFTDDANVLVRIGGFFLTIVFGHLPFMAAMNCLKIILGKTSKGKFSSN
jgi:hypothetical protein